jgi:hypothetical protein
MEQLLLDFHPNLDVSSNHIQPHRIINKSAGVDTKGHIEEASTPELCEKVRSVEDFQLISWGTVIPPTFDEMNSP